MGTIMGQRGTTGRYSKVVGLMTCAVACSSPNRGAEPGDTDSEDVDSDSDTGIDSETGSETEEAHTGWFWDEALPWTETWIDSNCGLLRDVTGLSFHDVVVGGTWGGADLPEHRGFYAWNGAVWAVDPLDVSVGRLCTTSGGVHYAFGNIPSAGEEGILTRVAAGWEAVPMPDWFTFDWYLFPAIENKSFFCLDEARVVLLFRKYGDDAIARLAMFDGSEWTVLAEMGQYSAWIDFNTSAALGQSPENIVFLGQNAISGKLEGLHFDGVGFETMTLPDLEGSIAFMNGSPDQGYVAVGNLGSEQHWIALASTDMMEWTEIPSPPEPADLFPQWEMAYWRFNDVWVGREGAIRLIGERHYTYLEGDLPRAFESPLVMRLEGQSWTEEIIPDYPPEMIPQDWMIWEGANLNAIWGTENDLFVAATTWTGGASAAVLRYHGEE